MKKTKNVLEFEEDADWYYETAMDASADGNLFYALKCAHEAVRIEPTCLEYRFLIGEIYYEMGLYDRAIDLNLEILALDPEVEESYYYCLRAFAEQGKYDAAYFYLQEGLKHGLLESGVVDPEQLTALKLPASEFRVVGERELACARLEEARTRLSAGYPAAALDLIGDFRPGSPCYDEALLLKADCYGDERAEAGVLALEERYRETGSPRLGAALARCLTLAGRSREAAEILDGIETTAGAGLEDYRRLAIAAAGLDRLDAAAAALDRALDLEPNDRALLLLRASVLSRLGKTAAAQDTLLELLILDPLDSVAMYANGVLQEGGILADGVSDDLPREETDRRVDMLLDWADDDAESRRKPVSRYRLAVLRWALKKRLLAEHDEFDLLTVLSEAEDVEVLLRNLCVDHDVPWDVRRLCAAVLCYCVDAAVTLRIADEYKILDCRAPAKIKDDDFLMCSWSLALVTLAFSAKDYEKPLRAAYARLATAPAARKISESRLAAVVIVGFVLHMEQVFTDSEHEGLLAGLISDLKEIDAPLRELLPVVFPGGK